MPSRQYRCVCMTITTADTTAATNMSFIYILVEKVAAINSLTQLASQLHILKKTGYADRAESPFFFSRKTCHKVLIIKKIKLSIISSSFYLSIYLEKGSDLKYYIKTKQDVDVSPRSYERCQLDRVYLFSSNFFSLCDRGKLPTRFVQEKQKTFNINH